MISFNAQPVPVDQLLDIKGTMTASQAYPEDFGKTYGQLAASNYHSSFLKRNFSKMF